MARGKDVDGPHPVDRHVGRRIQEKRLSLGYNQTDLARALGLTFQQVQKYEKGSNRISASKLWDTARFFRVEVGYFFIGLATASHGVAEQAVAFDYGDPVTRKSIEIARLAPQLSPGQQKLALDLIKALIATDAVEDV